LGATMVGSMLAAPATAPVQPVSLDAGRAYPRG